MTQDTNQSAPAAAVLRTIGDKDIKFLAAGEKINDIETAIRELVENSIDAGARNIEVRLTKFGVDSIEVDDNGSGIDEENFDKLAIRYHTSKIKDYKSFQESLQTFGFRGEALSCLVNIANVTIITKTKSAPTGCKLTYKKDGTFSRSPAARDTGTTVILKNLFHSLPVRRRELELNSKKQYDKVVKLLYEQALARPHIKFSLCRKSGARKEKDFTHGGTTLEGCLITIFGMKIMETLLAIRQPGSGPAPTSLELANLKIENEEFTNGAKRSRDSVDHEGEESRQTNQTDDNENDDKSREAASEKPLISSNFSANEATCITDPVRETTGTLAPPSKDFPQGPSKFYKRRSTNSKYAREKIHYTIHGYISKIGCGRNSTDCQFIFVNKKPCDIAKVSRLINEIYRNFNQNQQSPFYCLFIGVQNFATDFNVPRKRAVILQDESKLCDLVRECLEGLYATSVPASQKLCPVAQIPFAPQASARTMPATNGDGETSAENGRKADEQAPRTPASTNGGSPEIVLGLRIDDVADSIPDLYEVAPKRARKTVTPDMRPTHRTNTAGNKSLPGFENSYDLYKEQMAGASGEQQDQSGNGNDANLEQDSPRIDRADRHQERSPEKRRIHPAKQSSPPCRFQQDELMQDDEIKVYLSNVEDLGAALECDRIDRLPYQDAREFSFAIHPDFNAPAEDQLKLHLNKTSFTDMRVIGQFNCGFILTKLNKHIFIIDQHASDERFNFEEQLEVCPMVKQRMTNPLPLYLNLIQENAILNNMEAFKKHGFEFLVDTTKTVGYRVIQSSTSISRDSGRAESLKKEDIEELIDIAIQSPALLETHTLKKVKNLAASIACRKSVMVGDKLNWQQMTQIVGKMSGLKNPWVCAHNRPTIRHLMDTDWKVFDH